MNKTHFYLGCSSLSLILEQERQHWLLKTDKNMYTEDSETGDMFKGTIDNLGKQVVAESEKLGETNGAALPKTKFVVKEVGDVLDTATAALPFTPEMEGLMFTRITSSQVMIDSNKFHYKVKFKNCTTVSIPMQGDINSDEVFNFKWIKTTTPPVLMLMNSDGTFTIEKNTIFASGITEVTYYYPLTKSLQTLPLYTTSTSGEYTTGVCDSDEYIGCPLYWFICDQYHTGPKGTFNNYLISVSHTGASSVYDDKAYINVTSAFSPLSNYVIQCTTDGVDTFKNNDSDYTIPIKYVKVLRKSDSALTPLTLTSPVPYEITMIKGVGFTYVNSGMYTIELSNFDSNTGETPMKPIFDITYDNSYKFNNTSQDTGYAGIYFNTSYESHDASYPHSLYEWDGLPEWFTDEDDISYPNGAIYAIHNTPGAFDVTSKQTAALLFDTGKHSSNVFDEDDEMYNENRGRVYVLSNDDTIYENNKTTSNPKPARTVARICDIPTSVVQLTGIRNVAPTIVVDKQYVRTECSFEETDKDRLYNKLAPRWVKPTALNRYGSTILSTHSTEDNEFIFHSVNALNDVDLITFELNDFRIHTNLNPQVDVDQSSVKCGLIVDGGSGYKVNDIGSIIVGGFAFGYTVTEVSTSGSVLSLVLAPSEEPKYINLSNFDMAEGNSGLSLTYGSSPKTGNGGGLKIKFKIENYPELINHEGEIFDDLFALISDKTGLWMYTYDIITDSTDFPKPGVWNKHLQIADVSDSSPKLDEGALTLSDAVMNAMIPTMHEFPISLSANGVEQSSIDCMVTSSFVNIIDKSMTPIYAPTNTCSVNMNKFYSTPPLTLIANDKTTSAVIAALQENERLESDCYVIWKWKELYVTKNKEFEYCIIRRSFNNYISSDTISLLPANELRYKKYVNTNAGTTITWNVENVGQMVWVYDPTSTIEERYILNTDGSLRIEKVETSWKDIDIIKPATGNRVELVKDNVLQYNILTNNPGQVTVNPGNEEVIYQQPQFVEYPDLRIGTNIKNVLANHMPMGNWKLVFPQTKNIILSNAEGSHIADLSEMNVVRTTNGFQSSTIISDEFGNNLNDSTIIIDESSSTTFNVYNKSKNKWEKI